ncbi:Predicted ATP-binding protein involved in virulence [Clostridioides difficile]|nr:Predicted ATP-binding protein involved in virulence [Clostridioides difficile]SJP07764.1 Predicted ATP-binding protein involved in virulence [Clostridioides difficile]
MVCKIFITLKAILLKTQIIVTTHSPHILQIDSKEEIIVLDMDESGNVYKKELELGEYVVLGWTNEEILKAVMGVEHNFLKLYLKVIRNFEDAEKVKRIQLCYVNIFVNRFRL